ncbi:MAG: 50S ribosomal protein L25/general stress protein Ctc [Gemmatimonadota bacterium]|nr:50S ribosomal protein L25/general stress protein Ctc [Gemmatimonadota bacterium]
MAQTITLDAERRTGTGKGAARQLRLGGRIPAIIYGHGREPEALSLSATAFERALIGRDAESTVIDLTIGDASVKALIREVQRHPVQPKIMHVDFYEIRAGEKVSLEVPIHLIGSPDGVRNGGGVLDQVLRDLEILVLPTDIPDRLDVDVTALRIGQSLHVSDLTIPNAEILTDADATVCTVVAPRVEEEPVVAEVPEETVEPELIRKPKEEGEEEGEEDED